MWWRKQITALRSVCGGLIEASKLRRDRCLYCYGVSKKQKSEACRWCSKKVTETKLALAKQQSAATCFLHNWWSSLRRNESLAVMDSNKLQSSGTMMWPSDALRTQRSPFWHPIPQAHGDLSSNPRKKGKSHKSMAKRQVCIVSPGQEIGFVRWTISFFIIVSTKSNIHLPHATRELQYTNSIIRHHVLRDHHNG